MNDSDDKSKMVSYRYVTGLEQMHVAAKRHPMKISQELAAWQSNHASLVFYFSKPLLSSFVEALNKEKNLSFVHLKMGIPSEMRDVWVQRRRNSFLIPSPAEDEKKLRAERFSQEGVRAGVKAAAIAGVVTAVPTLIAVRKIPWAKANLNHTAQALIISGASIATYFITVDKTVLKSARRNSRAQFDKTA